MNVEKIANIIEGKILAGNGNADVAHFYAGDFLSHVIAGAPSGCAWLTVMNNINVAGVAVMADIKAIIICEKVEPVPELIARCAGEGIVLITSPLPLFDCAARIVGNL